MKNIVLGHWEDFFVEQGRARSRDPRAEGRRVSEAAEGPVRQGCARSEPQVMLRSSDRRPTRRLELAVSRAARRNGRCGHEGQRDSIRTPFFRTTTAQIPFSQGRSAARSGRGVDDRRAARAARAGHGAVELSSRPGKASRRSRNAPRRVQRDVVALRLDQSIVGVNRYVKPPPLRAETVRRAPLFELSGAARSSGRGLGAP